MRKYAETKEKGEKDKSFLKKGGFQVRSSHRKPSLPYHGTVDEEGVGGQYW